jgi:hypothetical protein
MANHKATTYTKKQIEQVIETGNLGPLLMYGNIQSRELASKILAERLKEVQPAYDELTPDPTKYIALEEIPTPQGMRVVAGIMVAMADIFAEQDQRIADLEAKNADLEAQLAVFDVNDYGAADRYLTPRSKKIYAVLEELGIEGGMSAWAYQNVYYFHGGGKKVFLGTIAEHIIEDLRKTDAAIIRKEIEKFQRPPTTEVDDHGYDDAAIRQQEAARCVTESAEQYKVDLPDEHPDATDLPHVSGGSDVPLEPIKEEETEEHIPDDGSAAASRMIRGFIAKGNLSERLKETPSEIVETDPKLIALNNALAQEGLPGHWRRDERHRATYYWVIGDYQQKFVEGWETLVHRITVGTTWGGKLVVEPWEFRHHKTYERMGEKPCNHCQHYTDLETENADLKQQLADRETPAEIVSGSTDLEQELAETKTLLKVVTEANDKGILRNRELEAENETLKTQLAELRAKLDQCEGMGA